MSISPIGPAINPEAAAPIRPDLNAPSSLEPESEARPAGPTFSDLLRSVLANDAAAQQATDSYAVGQTQNLHETMIAIEKADISLSLLVNVRNKLLDAYREVMRMS
jgi:flagellar hook-basal body complex protein FliE